MSNHANRFNRDIKLAKIKEIRDAEDQQVIDELLNYQLHEDNCAFDDVE